MRRLLVLLCAIPLLAGSSEINRPPRLEKLFRLQLHVPSQSGIYFTAWGDGDAIASHDGSDGKVVVYKRYLIWTDGCKWVATETLTPTAADRYDYTYREDPVSCPKGKTPNAVTTPRDGHVTVHPINDQKPLTPLEAWARGWDGSTPATP